MPSTSQIRARFNGPGLPPGWTALNADPGGSPNPATGDEIIDVAGGRLRIRPGTAGTGSGEAPAWASPPGRYALDSFYFRFHRPAWDGVTFGSSATPAGVRFVDPDGTFIELMKNAGNEYLDAVARPGTGDVNGGYLAGQAVPDDNTAYAFVRVRIDAGNVVFEGAPETAEGTPGAWAAIPSTGFPVPATFDASSVQVLLGSKNWNYSTANTLEFDAINSDTRNAGGTTPPVGYSFDTPGALPAGLAQDAGPDASWAVAGGQLVGTVNAGTTGYRWCTDVAAQDLSGDGFVFRVDEPASAVWRVGLRASNGQGIGLLSTGASTSPSLDPEGDGSWTEFGSVVAREASRKWFRIRPSGASVLFEWAVDRVDDANAVPTSWTLFHTSAIVGDGIASFDWTEVRRAFYVQGWGSGSPMVAAFDAVNAPRTAGGGGGGVTPSVTSVAVAPASASVAIGATQQLAATVVVAGGAAQSVTWSSSAPSIASVNASGLVTGVAAGSATITATSTADGTKTGTAAITVPAAAQGGGGTPGTPGSPEIAGTATLRFRVKRKGQAVTGAAPHSYRVTSTNPAVLVPTSNVRRGTGPHEGLLEVDVRATGLGTAKIRVVGRSRDGKVIAAESGTYTVAAP